MWLTGESVSKSKYNRVADLIAEFVLEEHFKVHKKHHADIKVTIRNKVVYVYGYCYNSESMRRGLRALIRKLKVDGVFPAQFLLVVDISSYPEQQLSKSRCGGRIVLANETGVVAGFATNESKLYLPLYLYLSEGIISRFENVRGRYFNNILYPTLECKVVTNYENDKFERLESVNIVYYSKSKISEKQIENLLFEIVVSEVIYNKIITPEMTLNFYNSFKKDNFGTSGVNYISGLGIYNIRRCAPLYARYIAKNIVMHGWADSVAIQAFFIRGQSNAKRININIVGEKVNKKIIEDFIYRKFRTSILGMVKELELEDVNFYKVFKKGINNNLFLWEKYNKDLFSK